MEVKASVIVRSYNRLQALCELLEVLLNQDFNSFEIIVIEQSTKLESGHAERLNKLSKDPRVKILNHPPLGGPSARNEGVRNASGEVIIFIDDDDLPATESWIRQHVEAYQNTKLVGFTGKHIFEGSPDYPYLPMMRWFIRRKVMSYSFFKFPYTFAQFNEDVADVEWLHGTNASLRKEWAYKAGLWDTRVQSQDEHSLAFKLKPYLKDGFHLAFKKEPAVIRRLDIEGGMGKRTFSIKKEFESYFHYFRYSVFPYHPELKKYYPIIFVLIIVKVMVRSTGKLVRNQKKAESKQRYNTPNAL